MTLVDVDDMYFHYPRAALGDGDEGWTLRGISLEIDRGTPQAGDLGDRRLVVAALQIELERGPLQVDHLAELADPVRACLSRASESLASREPPAATRKPAAML